MALGIGAAVVFFCILLEQKAFRLTQSHFVLQKLRMRNHERRPSLQAGSYSWFVAIKLKELLCKGLNKSSCFRC